MDGSTQLAIDTLIWIGVIAGGFVGFMLVVTSLWIVKEIAGELFNVSAYSNHIKQSLVKAETKTP